MEDRPVDREDSQSGLVRVQPPLVCTFHAIPRESIYIDTRMHIRTQTHTTHTEKEINKCIKTTSTYSKNIWKAHSKEVFALL